MNKQLSTHYKSLIRVSYQRSSIQTPTIRKLALAISFYKPKAPSSPLSKFCTLTKTRHKIVEKEDCWLLLPMFILLYYLGEENIIIINGMIVNI